MNELIAQTMNMAGENFEQKKEIADLRTQLKKVTEALNWYGQEWLYDLDHYRTAAPLSSLDNPRNIEVDGNPVLHDRGKRARKALGPANAE